MGSLTCDEMRELEGEAFKAGASAEGLMEKVGRRMAAVLLRRYPSPGQVIACIGTGNNGGDALVVLRYLSQAGWKIGVRYLHSMSQLGVLPRKMWKDMPFKIFLC